MASFPLPTTFFRCPPLSEKEEDALREFSERASVDLVHYSQLENGPVKWTLLEDDHDVQVFVGHDPNAPPRAVTYISSTEVHASIDEVSALFQAETPEDYAMFRHNFAKDLLDGALLYTIAKPTEGNPRHFVGVRWMAMTSPVPAVIKHRDYCAVEGRYDFDVNGRRGWMRSFKSIKLGACPDLEPTLGLVRGCQHRVGYVFIESDRPGFLKVTQLMQLSTGGRLPEWLNRLSAKRRARAIGQIETHVREKRLANTTFLSEAFLVDKTHRSRCFLCQRKFGAFGVKHSCRKCGEVVCKSCCRVWKVHMGTATGTRLEPTRVCTTCSLGSSQYAGAGGSHDCMAMSSNSTPKLLGVWNGQYDPSPRMASLPASDRKGYNDRGDHLTLGLGQPPRESPSPVEPHRTDAPYYYHPPSDPYYDEYHRMQYAQDRYQGPPLYPYAPEESPTYGNRYYDDMQYQGQPTTSPQPQAWRPPYEPQYRQPIDPYAYRPQYTRSPSMPVHSQQQQYYSPEPQHSPYRALPPLPLAPQRQTRYREPHDAPTTPLTSTPKEMSDGDGRNDLILLDLVEPSNGPDHPSRDKQDYPELTKAFTGGAAPASSSTTSDGSSLLLRNLVAQQQQRM